MGIGCLCIIPQKLLDMDLPGGIADMIFAADDKIDPSQHIVTGTGEVISRRTVSLENDETIDFIGGSFNLAFDDIVTDDWCIRFFQTNHKRYLLLFELDEATAMHRFTASTIAISYFIFFCFFSVRFKLFRSTGTDKCFTLFE